MTITIPPLTSQDPPAQETALRTLRTSLVGHTARKRALLSSPLLPQLWEVLARQPSLGVAYEGVSLARSIVDYALATNTPLLEELLPQILLDVTLAHPEVAEPAFETVAALVESVLGTVLPSTPLLKLLYVIISGQYPLSLTLAALALVRLLPPTSHAVQQTLYPAVLARLCLLVRSIYRQVTSCDEGDGPVDGITDTPPNRSLVCALLNTLLVLLAEPAKSPRPFPKQLQVVATGLLRLSDLELRLASADLLVRTRLSPDLLLPPLVACVDQFYALPVGVHTPLQLLTRMCEADELCVTRLVSAGLMGRLRKLVDSEDARADVFLAMSVLAGSDEQSRAAAATPGLQAAIKQALERHEQGLDVETAFGAACLVRALSRSSILLRTFFADLDISKVVVSLLSRECDVRVTAALLGYVANSVLVFSTTRQELLAEGVFSLLHRHAQSESVSVRLHAVGALRNAFYNALPQLMHQLDLPLIFGLCRDHSEPHIQEASLSVLRNLSCNSPEAANHIFVRWGVGGGSGFLEFVTDEISRGGISVVAAVYIVVHFAAAGEDMAEAVCEHRPLLEAMREAMRTGSNEVRLAVVWVVANLTWQDTFGVGSDLRLQARQATLKEAGFDKAIGDIVARSSVDVQERARVALQQLSR